MMPALLALACGRPAPVPPASPAPAIRDSLQRPVADFAAETTRVAFIERAVQQWTGDDEVRAELELLRLRAIDRVSKTPGMDGFSPYTSLSREPPPPPGARAWTESHPDIAFSEPGANWLVPSDVYWKLHDRYPGVRVSDEIAWQAASAGIPGECEGIAGCYMGALLLTTGHYLETHPAGAYRAQALETVRTTLEGIDGVDAGKPLCGDEAVSQAVQPDQLRRMRKALMGASAGDSTIVQPALSALATLERRCGG